jgi:hypothetical protein
MYAESSSDFGELRQIVTGAEYGERLGGLCWQ